MLKKQRYLYGKIQNFIFLYFRGDRFFKIYKNQQPEVIYRRKIVRKKTLAKNTVSKLFFFFIFGDIF